MRDISEEEGKQRVEEDITVAGERWTKSSIRP